MPKASARANQEWGTYVDRVRRVRRGLTAQEVASIVDVQVRQVQHWAAGNNHPQGAARERLLELDYVVELLGEVYDDEGIEIWLHSKNRSLDGRRPLDILIGGHFQEITAAVERLTSGTM